ncbi:hypothetical protein HA466_0255880 [Hirschfeldia incana]|nr:hypothetical protein HA466_0255880 [Hirschfeldia incana]
MNCLDIVIYVPQVRYHVSSWRTMDETPNPMLGLVTETFSLCWDTLSLQLESVTKLLPLVPNNCLDIVVYVPNEHLLPDPLPDLLPDEGIRLSLSDITALMEFTWTLEKPYLLCGIMKQILGICWAIAYVRQLEFLLKKNWMLHFSDHLSIQDFVDHVPKHRLSWTGGCKSLEYVGDVLVVYGVCLEKECPLESPERIDGSINPKDTGERFRPKSLSVILLADLIRYHGDAYAGYNEFHDDLQQLIRKEGVASVFLSPVPATRDAR